MNTEKSRSKAMLVVLDGFGIGENTQHNAITNAKMPFYNSLLENFPHSQILTHGKAVGLPDHTMGNSEVGHMTLGAGRIIYQDLMRINNSIEDESFFSNKALINAIENTKKNNSKVHLMGLLSDGGVHSHIDHILAALDLCLKQEVAEVCLHPFLDGRDTPPQSAKKYLEQILNHKIFDKNQTKTKVHWVSMSGRYWAMDRDQRWERIEKSFNCITGKSSVFNSSNSNDHPVLNALQCSYDSKVSDEFFEPVLFNPDKGLEKNDSVLFLNFRADRARQITQKITNTSEISPIHFTCMSEYSPDFSLPVAFPPIKLDNVFGEVLEKNNLSQLRIAETEKYAHVTFFFNGGREKPFNGEDRLLIPSPKDVDTYDQKPEMSALEVTQNAVDQMNSLKHDFVLLNYANGDMVGHTGNFNATLKAMNVLDTCLKQLVECAQKNDYHVLITADHGNAEEMIDKNDITHTQHTLNPVPLVWVSPKKETSSLSNGTLADIMPTLCKIMNLELPEQTSGKNLVR